MQKAVISVTYFKPQAGGKKKAVGGTRVLTSIKSRHMLEEKECKKKEEEKERRKQEREQKRLQRQEEQKKEKKK